MSETEETRPGTDRQPTRADLGVPEWDDEYLDRVADRLMYNFDLERDRTVRGERFDMYGSMRVENYKQLFHEVLNYAHHDAEEHLFVRRADAVTTADVEALVSLGHDLADEWVTPSEEHFGTDFTFVVVTEDVPAAVREFVDDFSDRTLLKLGYYGHYEVNLVVASPDKEVLTASDGADVARAFALWTSPTADPSGLLARLLTRLRG